MDLAQVSMTLVLLVLLALAFDFLNGFHDAANSIATVVSTGVLKPWQAVLWAAFFNFLAWAFFELAVAATIGKGIIDPAFVDSRVIFGALVGAIAWNLITWYYGIPSSSSHALIGGLIGAALDEGRRRAAALAGNPQDRSVHLHLAAARPGARRAAHADRVVDCFRRRRGASTGGSGGCSSFLRRLQPGPRRQRRAEDHGHHLAAADRDGVTTAGSPAPGSC